METIREGRIGDLPAIVDIYNSYIADTAITFDIEPITVESRREWFAQFAPDSRRQVFVAEEHGAILGFAYTGVFRARAAYERSVESTIYLEKNAQRKGLGRRLYDHLFDAIQGTGVHRIYAGITLPNDASIALHERCGFTPVGTFTHAGYKFDRYWDVVFYEKKMGE